MIPYDGVAETGSFFRIAAGQTLGKIQMEYMSGFRRQSFLFGCARLPSRSLTCPVKSYLPNRKVVFQPSFFRGYVKLPGGNSLQSPIVAGYRVPGIHVSLKLPRSGCQ